MEPNKRSPAIWWYGPIAGIIIAAVDNFAFDGEVSPIVIVLMLLLSTAVAGTIWRRYGFLASALTWIFIPGAHLVRFVLGLLDTLHPNTFGSIMALALFTAVIAAAGCGTGIGAAGLFAGRSNKQS